MVGAERLPQGCLHEGCKHQGLNHQPFWLGVKHSYHKTQLATDKNQSHSLASTKRDRMLMVVVKLQQMASSYRFTQEMTISHWLHGWRCPRPPHIQSLPGSGRRGHKSPSPVLPMSPKAQVPHPSSPINSMNLPGVNSIVDKGTHTPLIFTFYRRLLPSLSLSLSPYQLTRLSGR